MKQAEAKKWADKAVDFNTNNGWGFGGVIATEYQKGNMSAAFGKRCFRHAPSESYRSFYIDGKRVSEEEFDKAVQEEK